MKYTLPKYLPGRRNFLYLLLAPFVQFVAGCVSRRMETPKPAPSTNIPSVKEQLLLNEFSNKTLLGGDEIMVQWSQDESIASELQYSIDNGQNWLPIINTKGLTQFLWQVPQQNTSKSKIRLWDEARTTESGVFSIQKTFAIELGEHAEFQGQNGQKQFATDDLGNFLLRYSANEILAISLVCTHFGCTVRPNGNKLSCPCHGSEFNASGNLERGPADRDLDRWKTKQVAGRNRVLVYA